VLETDDPEQIHRLLELHGERLQERLVEQLRALARVERLLTAAPDDVPASASAA
jgi:hypothetical protein